MNARLKEREIITLIHTFEISVVREFLFYFPEYQESYENISKKICLMFSKIQEKYENLLKVCKNFLESYLIFRNFSDF